MVQWGNQRGAGGRHGSHVVAAAVDERTGPGAGAADVRAGADAAHASGGLPGAAAAGATPAAPPTVARHAGARPYRAAATMSCPAEGFASEIPGHTGSLGPCTGASSRGSSRSGFCAVVSRPAAPLPPWAAA